VSDLGNPFAGIDIPTYFSELSVGNLTVNSEISGSPLFSPEWYQNFRVASQTQTGITRYATNAETAAGTATDLAISPATLAAASGSGLEPGIVVSLSYNGTPSGRWLYCNGAAVSRTTYAALYNKYSNNGTIPAIWGNGNGTTTFNLPDLRGMFIRGWNDGGVADPGRVFGSYQHDAVIYHEHIIGFTASGIESGPNTGAVGGGQSWTTGPKFAGTYDNVPYANENRPKNIAMKYLVSY